MSDSPTTAQIVPVNGMEMYCETYGEGEPLVLLHGFNGIGEHWKLVFPEMPRGYRTIDVLALLDALHVNRFQAIGMSAGAKTLLHIATQRPSRVEAMVLVSAAPYFPHQARAAMAQIGIDNHSEEEWKVMRNRHQHGDDQIRALWEQGNAMKDSYDDMNFTPPLLSTTTARTLIVHGDRDPFYPVSLALEMYAAMPKSYLWIVPNGGHGPIFGTMARPFAETALAFLRGEWESR